MLRRLNISQYGFDTAAVQRLLNANWFAGLTHLSLSIGTARDLCMLLATRRSTLQLQSFSIAGHSGMGSEAFAALCSAKSLKHLRELHIGSQKSINSTSMEVLSQSLLLARPEQLCLSGNSIPDLGAKKLAASPLAGNLRELSLRHTKIGLRGLEAILNSSCMKSLKKLDLTGSKLESDLRKTMNEAVLGTRLCVESLLARMADGWSDSEILRNYPGLCREDIVACLDYAYERIR